LSSRRVLRGTRARMAGTTPTCSRWGRRHDNDLRSMGATTRGLTKPRGDRGRPKLGRRSGRQGGRLRRSRDLGQTDVDLRCRSGVAEPRPPRRGNRDSPAELGLRRADEYNVRDLWAHTTTVTSEDVDTWVPPARRENVHRVAPLTRNHVRNQWSNGPKITISAMKLRHHRGIPTMSHALGDGQPAVGHECRCAG
jgi:hypothetical protein